ncbi:MAG: hypothetical protein PHN90_08260 [Methanothrix sp.]|nr:hypothetical protein [Methanothrix sp.]
MAGDLGEGASASPPGARKPAILLLREVHRAHIRPESSARISPSPSRITSPRRIGPKEGGLRRRRPLEGAAGTSFPNAEPSGMARIGGGRCEGREAGTGVRAQGARAALGWCDCFWRRRC